MDQLLQKLVKSKAIMDKTEGIKRGSVSQGVMEDYNVTNPQFDIPNAKYNIPAEFLQEQPQQMQPLLSQPRENTKPVGAPTVEAIKNSRLPDEIKKLMIEHPIAQAAQQQQTTLSADLIERASRLMKEQDNNYVPESAKPKTVSNTNSNLDYNVIQKMIEEAVQNALKKNGLIAESTEKTNELFTFKVGKHIFEGKVTKIKKLS